MVSYLEKLFSLENKVSIVTGAAGGLGKAISEALLRSGSTVVLVDIKKEELDEVEKYFLNENLDAQKFCCDITKSKEILKLLNFILKKFAKIDILINNAGVSYPSSSLDYPDNLWEKTYAVNLKAPFQLSKKIADIMKDQKSGGNIINITSINSELAFPNNPAYQAFKGALKQLTRSMALDFSKYKIRVNSVGPGYFLTKMTEKSWNDKKRKKMIENKTLLKKWGMPNDLSGAIIFLASNASSYITGQSIYVDGGWSIKGMD